MTQAAQEIGKILEKTHTHTHLRSADFFLCYIQTHTYVHAATFWREKIKCAEGIDLVVFFYVYKIEMISNFIILVKIRMSLCSGVFLIILN